MMLICPHFRQIEYGVLDSFKRLGIEVYPLFFSMGMDKKHYIQRLKNKMGLSIDDFLTKEKEKFNSKVLKQYNQIKPDFVYVIQGRWVSEDTLIEINKLSYTSLYLWDMVSLFPEMEETFKHYNSIYSFDAQDTKALKNFGYNAKFKPSGYDSSVYYPISCDKEYDISFIGAMYPERVKLLKELIVEFPDIKWAIYGEYAPIRMPLKWLRWRLTSDYHYFKNKNIEKDEVNKIYNKSKIVLSIVRENQMNGWSARLTEILGTQSFQLTNYYPSVSEEFAGCLVTYSDKDDLIKHIKYYLYNDKDRTKVAQNGYIKVKEQFSDDVLNQMIINDYVDWRNRKE